MYRACAKSDYDTAIETIKRQAEAIEKLKEIVQDHAEAGNIENYDYLTDRFDAELLNSNPERMKGVE